MINYNDKESLAYLENYLVLQHGFKRTIQIEVPVAMLMATSYLYPHKLQKGYFLITTCRIS